jgi:HEAT repeat protein
LKWVASVLAGLLAGAWLWAASTPRHDVHAQLRTRLIESELGSAVYLNFATPAKMPDVLMASTDALLAQLRSAIPDLRWSAAGALAERGDDARVVDALIRAMRDPRGTRRVCVMAEALGRIGDPRAVGALTAAVSARGNEDLRVCAIQSLGMIGDKRALPTLIRALQQGNMPVEAAKSLARLGGDAAVAPIAAAAADPALRFWMIESLGELGRPGALPYLARYAHDPSPVREAVAEARWKIAVLSSPQPMQALIDVLAHDPDHYRRMWAAFRLGERQDARAAAVLVQALNDADGEVRGRAAAALVRIGAPALPLVRNAALRTDGRAADTPANEYALAILGYIGNDADALALDQAAKQLPEPARTTALRSAQLIRHFDSFRAQARSAVPGLDRL